MECTRPTEYRPASRAAAKSALIRSRVIFMQPERDTKNLFRCELFTAQPWGVTENATDPISRKIPDI
jgi:hypothetical protein